MNVSRNVTESSLFRSSRIVRRMGVMVTLAFAVVLSGCTFIPTQTVRPVAMNCSALRVQPDSPFGIQNADENFASTSQVGAGWNFPFPGPFVWGELQTQKKSPYDFTVADRIIVDGGAYGVSTHGVLWGYADWDQRGYTYAEERACRGSGFADILPQQRCRPFNDDAYSAFVTETVERYDGDRLYDADGLCLPVLSWEVAGFPQRQDASEGTQLFRGGPVDYFNLLRISYDAVKGSCPQCTVHFGTLEGTEESYAFLDDVMRLGGAAYFDALTVSASSSDIASVLARYQEILESYAHPKPLWAIVEVDVDNSAGAPGSLIRGMTEALAAGAERVFHRQLTSVPDVRPEQNTDALLDLENSPTESFIALKTFIGKMQGMHSAEKIQDGVYRFGRDNLPSLVVAWQEGNSTTLPESIRGILRVTTLDGRMEARDISELDLRSDPVLIE